MKKNYWDTEHYSPHNIHCHTIYLPPTKLTSSPPFLLPGDIVNILFIHPKHNHLRITTLNLPDIFLDYGVTPKVINNIYKPNNAAIVRCFTNGSLPPNVLTPPIYAPPPVLRAIYGLQEFINRTSACQPYMTIAAIRSNEASIYIPQGAKVWTPETLRTQTHKVVNIGYVL